VVSDVGTVRQRMPAVPTVSSSFESELAAISPASVSDLGRLRMHSRITEQVGEGVVVTNNDGWFQYVNPEFAAQHAGTVEELTGAHMSSFYSPEALEIDVQPIIAAALEHGIARGEVTRTRRDGTQFPARLTLSLLRDDAGELIGRVLCVQDITAQRELEQALREAALYDALTGLPNRRLLRDRIEHALVLRVRRRSGVAALFVDLDGFKQINDRHGHDVGDEVLVEVARRLVIGGRGCDTVARYGGDEYVILAEELVDAEQAAVIGARVLSRFAEPVRTLAGDIAVSASIGIHLATDDDDFESLLRTADRAMYDAKRSGRDGIRFSTPVAVQSPR
jgi:diguanylate cyclase (GGDEF)-like protein/PAS domain S-box-containing protein